MISIRVYIPRVDFFPNFAISCNLSSLPGFVPFDWRFGNALASLGARPGILSGAASLFLKKTWRYPQ